MADKPAPEDDTYSDEVAARRTEATIRAMIGMKPKPQKSPAPKAKTRPASKQPVDKRKSGA
jgi:hypothetical protein